MLLNGTFESVAVSTYSPAQICRGFEEFHRQWVAWVPEMRGTIVNGIRYAQNFCRFVSRILRSAKLLQVSPAPGLDVTMQDVREGLEADCGAMT
jgi:hypothetical protein